MSAAARKAYPVPAQPAQSALAGGRRSRATQCLSRARTLTLFGATARHSRYRATSGRKRFTLRTSARGRLRATRARPRALRGSREARAGDPRAPPAAIRTHHSRRHSTSGAGSRGHFRGGSRLRRAPQRACAARGGVGKRSCSRLRRRERGLRRVDRGRLGTRGLGDAGTPGPAAVSPPGLPVPHHLTETQSPGRFSKSQFINHNKGINNLDAKVRLRRETDG